MEIYFAVTPVFVQQLCPKCKAGFMVHQSHYKEIFTAPISYQHICSNPNCLHQEYYRGATYPQFRNVVSAQPIDPQPVFEGPVMQMPGSDQPGKKDIN